MTSSEVLPIQDGAQLDEAAILKIIEKYGNDSVLITHPVAYDETEVFSRDELPNYPDYYSFYSYSQVYDHWPSVTWENEQITIETRLYDIKTESLLWRVNRSLPTRKPLARQSARWLRRS